jgi:hypothetical protein
MNRSRFLHTKMFGGLDPSSSVGDNFKKRILLLIIILTFPIFPSFGQDFTAVKSDSITNKVKIDSVKIVQSYTLDNFDYYVGWYKRISSNKELGLRLYVFNPNGELIYKSNIFQDSYTHSLTFFKSEINPKQTIILGHSSNEYSWGNEVYLLEDAKLYHLGLLDVGTFDSMDMPWDISSLTEIWTLKDGLRFTFSCDSLTYNPGGRNERILTKEQIEYKYEGRQLIENIKN